MSTAKITIKSQILLDHIQRMLHGTAKSLIIEKALLEFDKNLAFQNFNKAYIKLKNDPIKWAEELKERNELEGTLEDGLFEDDE